MPQFKQVLGVDLGINTVKIVELALDKTGVQAVRAASAPTGVVPGMSPEEIRSAIVAATKECIKKGRFGTRKAVFSISGQKAFIRRFRLPKTSDERLQKIIQYEARQQIPFPLDKTALQYQYRELPDEGEVEILLVAVRNDEVRDFMALAAKTGLTPVAVGVSSFALYNGQRFSSLTSKDLGERLDSALGRKKKAPAKPKKGKAAEPEVAAEPTNEQIADEFAIDEVKGFINLGAMTYDLAIGRTGKGGGMIGFVRTVPLGGDEMTKAIMKTCRVDSFRDAERIKTSSCQLMSYSFDDSDESGINQQASQAVTEVADKMVAEIRKTLDFFITQPDGMAIDALVLSGGQAQLPGLAPYLEEKLTVPVSISDRPIGDALRWQESFGAMAPYMISIGLAVQGLSLSDLKVDFLPEDRKIVRDFPFKVTAIMALIVMITAGIGTQAGQQYAAKYVAESENLDGVMKGGSAQIKAAEDAQALHDQTAADFLALSKIYGQRKYWIEFLSTLATIKPPPVLIEDIQMSHSGKVTITGVSEFQVSAAFFNSAIAEAFAGRLRVAAEKEKANPAIERIDQAPELRNQFRGKIPTRFVIGVEMKDKINHLNITPTPDPRAVPVGGVNQGAGGDPLLDEGSFSPRVNRGGARP